MRTYHFKKHEKSHATVSLKINNCVFLLRNNYVDYVILLITEKYDDHAKKAFICSLLSIGN